MSWWTKNRKYVGLLGAAAAAAASGGTASPLLAGLFGTGAAASAVPPMAGMAGPGVAALAGESLAPTAMQSAMAMGGKAMKGLGMASQGMQLAGGMMNPGPPPPSVQPRPPMAPQAPNPVGPGYTPIDDQPPLGFDPNQWALMSPEQKAAMKAQRGMA